MNKQQRKAMFLAFCYGYLNDKAVKERVSSSDIGFKSFRDYKIYYTLVYLGLSNSKYYKIFHFFLNRVAFIEYPLSFLFLFYKFVIAICRYIAQKKQKPPRDKILYYSSGLPKERIRRLIKKIELDLNEITIVTNHNDIKDYAGCSVLPLLSIVSIADLLCSLWYSCKFLIFFYHRYGRNDLLFRLYSSFDFFLYFVFVIECKENNKFLFFDSYSRWSYLYNEVKVNHIWVQHGILGEDISWIKLNNINNTYFLNPKQKDICERMLFGHKTNAHYMKRLEFCSNEKLANNGKMDLLLVCNLLFWPIEKAIVETCENFDVNIYLKPFPKDDPEKYKSFALKNKNIYVLDRYDYPEVDFVISYISTLADEYEDNGIEVVRYEGSDIGEIEAYVNSKLKCRLQRHLKQKNQ